MGVHAKLTTLNYIGVVSDFYTPSLLHDDDEGVCVF